MPTAAHPKDCDCRDCVAAAFRDSPAADAEQETRLPAYQEAIVADALVDLVAAWESKTEGHPDYIEPRLWVRRMELSVGYARQVLADLDVKDRRLLSDADEEREGSHMSGPPPVAARVAA